MLHAVRFGERYRHTQSAQAPTQTNRRNLTLSEEGEAARACQKKRRRRKPRPKPTNEFVQARAHCGTGPSPHPSAGRAQADRRCRLGTEPRRRRSPRSLRRTRQSHCPECALPTAQWPRPARRLARAWRSKRAWLPSCQAMSGAAQRPGCRAKTKEVEARAAQSRAPGGN